MIHPVLKPMQSSSDFGLEQELFVQLRPFPREPSLAMEAAWQDLERRSLSRNPFLSSSFLLPQWRHETPESALLLTVQDQAGRWLLAGAFERVRGTRELPLPHLLAVRTLHTFQTGLLVDATDCEEVVETLWTFLRDQNLHGLSFPLLPVRGSLACLMRERCEIDGTGAFGSDIHERALTSLAEMIDPGMSSKRAKSLRRGRRALEKQGELRFQIRDQTGIDDFLHLESLGWKGSSGTAISCSDQETDAFRRVVAGLGKQKRVRFAELILADRVVASMCLFKSHSDYFAFKIGWDPQLERGCPGFLLAAEIQSHLSDFPECERIDSCATAGSFLEHVWAARKPMGVMTFTTTRWGAAAARGTEMVRGLIRCFRQTGHTESAPEPVESSTDELVGDPA